MSNSFIILTKENNSGKILSELDHSYRYGRYAEPDNILAKISHCRELVLKGADDFQFSEKVKTLPYLWVGSYIRSSGKIRKEYKVLNEIFNNIIDKLLDMQDIKHEGASLQFKIAHGNITSFYGPLSNDLVPDKLIVVNVVNAFTKAFIESINSYKHTVSTTVNSARDLSKSIGLPFESAIRHNYTITKKRLKVMVKALHSLKVDTSLDEIVKSGLLTYDVFNMGKFQTVLKHMLKHKLPDISMKRDNIVRGHKCGTGILDYYQMHDIRTVVKEVEKKEKVEKVILEAEEATYNRYISTPTVVSVNWNLQSSMIDLLANTTTVRGG
jgi:hypothetical protein